ncbi:MAG: NAD-dependent epimerase/dehydratase family protein [Pseudomonadota bacterium]
MKILFVGGSGEISFACVEQAIAAGHKVTVFNRGLTKPPPPNKVQQMVGDFLDNASYQSLASQDFDVVCQFLAYNTEQVERDIGLFSKHCAQYVFVSTASAYEKSQWAQPPHSHIISEDTAISNPFWEYSRRKAACETRLLEAHEAGILPVTIVRPSHTYRARLPSTVIDGNHLAWRLLNNKPVIVHGDGESVWTLTHASDFARAFVALCGLEGSLGECIHITASEAHTWNNILRGVANTMGKEAAITPVLSKTLVRYEPRLEGPLLGDKSNSLLFDNRKITRLINDWRCNVSLQDGMTQAWQITERLMRSGYQPDPKLDSLIDRIILRESQ